MSDILTLSLGGASANSLFEATFAAQKARAPFFAKTATSADTLANQKKQDQAQDLIIAGENISDRVVKLSSYFEKVTKYAAVMGKANDSSTEILDLLNEAKDIALKARKVADKVKAYNEESGYEARLTGTTDLTTQTNLVDFSGIDTGDQLTVLVTQKDAESFAYNQTITVEETDSAQDFIDKINAADPDNSAILASLTAEGKIQIETQNLGDLRLRFGVGHTDFANTMGFGDVENLEASGKREPGNPNRAYFSAVSDGIAQSRPLYEDGEGTFATINSKLTDLKDSSGGALRFAGDPNDALVVSVNGDDDFVEIGKIVDLTVGDFMHEINNHETLSEKIAVEFSEDTGRITISRRAGNTSSVQIGAQDFDSLGQRAEVDFDFGVENLLQAREDTVIGESESIRFKPDGATYAEITGTVDLTQYSALTDASGVNTNDLFQLIVSNPGYESRAIDANIYISAGNDAQDLVDKINNLNSDPQNPDKVQASLTAGGELKIEAVNGGDMRLYYYSGDDMAGGLGLNATDTNESKGTNALSSPDRYGVTIAGTNTIQSSTLYKYGGEYADLETSLKNLKFEGGDSLGIEGADSDNIVISLNGDGNFIDIGNIADLTVGGLVDSINNNASLNTKVQASYEDGRIKIAQLDSAATSIQIAAQDRSYNGTVAKINFDFGLEGQLSTREFTPQSETESIFFGRLPNGDDTGKAEYNVKFPNEAREELSAYSEQIKDIYKKIETALEGADSYKTNLLTEGSLNGAYDINGHESFSIQSAGFTAGNLGTSKRVDYLGTSDKISEAIRSLNRGIVAVTKFQESIRSNATRITSLESLTEKKIEILEDNASLMAQQAKAILQGEDIPLSSDERKESLKEL